MAENYLKIQIDEQDVDIASIEELPIAISYKLEDTEDFQVKDASSALSIKLPATVKNDRVFNTFYNPSVEDLSQGEDGLSLRPCIIEAKGIELLVGKAFLSSSEHTDRPLSYEIDCYGNNADWMIDLKEATLFDFFKRIKFQLTRQTIVNSWNYDGRSELLPYVFAPVRYGEAMGDPDDSGVFDDKNMKPDYMKPSLSKYWLIYWAFQSVGYRVQSSFFDTDYFRRQVMLWTWGNFRYSEGTKQDNLKFSVQSAAPYTEGYRDVSGIINLSVTDTTSPGRFNNNGSYSWDAATNTGKWTYLPAFNYQLLNANFYIAIFINGHTTAGSDLTVKLRWYKNGIQMKETTLVDLHSPSVGLATRREVIDTFEESFGADVNPGDQISFNVFMDMNDTSLGAVAISAQVDEFRLDYFKTVLGSTIDFENFTALKKYKFLDFLRGVVDEFNLSVQTDSSSKVVYLEPTHAHSLNNDFSVLRPGYFNQDWIDWNDKQDLLKTSRIDRFKDYERELLFTYKGDTSDGILKIVQDRHQITLAEGKYVLPQRFKAGNRTVENRFFSPVMHYDVEQWKYITGEAPQMICMIPENISGTSSEEAQNTFEPKSAYYKGIVPGMGWVFDRKIAADGSILDSGERTSFPYMFAVNYKPGGENDPILSYSDEKIGSGTSFVIGKGLLRRFFLQRLAIIRYGKYYTTFFRLNLSDVTNWLHREHIVCKGDRYELVEINSYKPLHEESTQCSLRKWAPITKADSDSIYPLPSTVLGSTVSQDPFDIKYNPLKCLLSDIHK